MAFPGHACGKRRPVPSENTARSNGFHDPAAGRNGSQTKLVVARQTMVEKGQNMSFGLSLKMASFRHHQRSGDSA